MKKTQIMALFVLVALVAAPAGARPDETPPASREAPRAAAAPELQSSEPSDGAELEHAPSQVSASFSEPLDPSSSLIVLDECGESVSGATEVFANEMTTDVTGHDAGHYTVQYRAVGVGGVSGTSQGSFSFHVAQGPDCDDDGGGGKCPNHEDGHHGERCGNNNNRNGNKRCGHDGGHNGEQCKRHGNGNGRNHRGRHPDRHGGGPSHPRRGHPSDDHEEEGHDDDGMTGHGSSGEHGSRGGHDAGRHDRDGRHRGGAGRSGAGDPGPLASGRSGDSRADASAVALALLFSMLLGVTGGWVLRMSPSATASR